MGEISVLRMDSFSSNEHYSTKESQHLRVRAKRHRNTIIQQQTPTSSTSPFIDLLSYDSNTAEGIVSEIKDNLENNHSSPANLLTSSFSSDWFEDLSNTYIATPIMTPPISSTDVLSTPNLSACQYQGDD